MFFFTNNLSKIIGINIFICYNRSKRHLLNMSIESIENFIFIGYSNIIFANI